MALFLTYVPFTLKVGHGEKTTKMIAVGQNTNLALMSRRFD